MRNLNKRESWYIYCIAGILLGLFIAYRNGVKGWASVGYGAIGAFAGCLLSTIKDEV